MSMLKAAIIDDGAAETLFENVRSLAVSENLQLNEDVSFTNERSHSSICMSIIKKYADISGVEWLNINIMNSQCNSGVDSFVKALEYCRENNVKLIHLSIGSRNFNDFKKLKDEIDLLLKNDTVIVAALANNGEFTVPACLDGVIGVKRSDDLKDNELYYLDDAPQKVNFLASSRHLLKVEGKPEYSAISSSYATPVVTAAAIDVLKAEPFLNAAGVIERIKAKSKKDFCCSEKKEPFIEGNADMLAVPVVLVRLNDTVLQSELVTSLKELFVQNGYNAFCAYSNVASENLLPEKKLLNYLLFIQEFYNSDIIILGYTDEKLFSDFQSYDVIVSDDNDLKNSSAAFVHYSKTNDLNTLYNKILHIFNEGENQ